MVDRDLALARIAAIDSCLRRIADVRGERRAVLLPIEVDEIVLLNLQRAVQATIDLATHIVATEGYGLPGTVAENFTLLERQGIIDAQLAERLRKMVGFRNIAVHNYQALNPDIVEAIVTNHLGDLREFSARIAQRFSL